MWIESDIDDDYNAREEKKYQQQRRSNQKKKTNHNTQKYSQQIRYTIVERRKLCVMIIAKETNDNRIQI